MPDKDAGTPRVFLVRHGRFKNTPLEKFSLVISICFESKLTVDFHVLENRPKDGLEVYSKNRRNDWLIIQYVFP